MKENNKWKYQGDNRYEKVYEKMQLLDIQDITTDRQHKNGTIVWKLPIKDQDTGILIEVASFASGYVRNQGKSTRSNFQLNKRCEGEPQYYEMKIGKGTPSNPYETVYRKFTTRGCVLIPIEIDRLEYLISYCLKNYYIKNANRVPNGEYVPEWKYDNACRNGHDMLHEQKQYENQRVKDLEERYSVKLEEKLYDLQNKLATIKRIADYE